MPNIYQIAEANKARLLAGERRASLELVEAYAVAYRQSKASIEALTADIEAARVSGSPVSSSWLFERDRMSRLQGEIESEMSRFSVRAAKTVTGEQQLSFEFGARDAKNLIIESKGASVAAELGGLDARSVEAVAGFAGDGTPLRSLFDELGAHTSRRVRDELIAGVAQGAGARVIASRIKDAFGGDLARALTLSRTEVLRSYRTAVLDTYRATPHIVKAYRWQSTLSPRTCGLCWAMHARMFPLNVPMSTHPNCRCTLIPVTDRTPERTPSGAEEFAKLEKGYQLEVLGKGKFDLYKAGKLELSDLVGERIDARWGVVRYERSLRDIVG
ncbi:MAG: phage head morphogenesis protein [Pyrinomonadaceae bacterium MAG19_C2-C3]|nr:phage head morphogenesis protein [Pyrinomonadaceae bacterium MAG19_C2-C3]